MGRGSGYAPQKDLRFQPNGNNNVMGGNCNGFVAGSDAANGLLFYGDDVLDPLFGSWQFPDQQNLPAQGPIDMDLGAVRILCPALTF